MASAPSVDTPLNEADGVTVFELLLVAPNPWPMGVKLLGFKCFMVGTCPPDDCWLNFLDPAGPEKLELAVKTLLVLVVLDKPPGCIPPLVIDETELLLPIEY